MRYWLILGAAAIWPLAMAIPAGAQPFGYPSNCANAQRVINQAIRDRRTGHSGAAADLLRTHSAEIRRCRNSPAVGGYFRRYPGDGGTWYGPANRGLGAYDEHHQWRDADWWRKNRPAWVHQHHPEWAKAGGEHRTERPASGRVAPHAFGHEGSAGGHHGSAATHDGGHGHGGAHSEGHHAEGHHGEGHHAEGHHGEKKP
ncbi:MAG: hypothetical protein ACREQI_13275 [Candidatus Binataceae bacterium]